MPVVNKISTWNDLQLNNSKLELEKGILVTHSQHGNGRVVVDLGETVIVRFRGAVEQVLRSELNVAMSLRVAIQNRKFSTPIDAVVRAQALAISSVNDQWGVFSRSRIQLLPHQLWVCHKVNQSWPFRWLIADDVGLGKTIECGLVLMPLIASARVRRLLILTPAKLVPQWQYRLKDMFDIRLQRYVSEADTQHGNFWDSASVVVASFHTLRAKRRARERLLDAESWDLLIVDEAHHLGVDTKTGETLAYSLISDLENRKKINSLLFFTGTPHRGKDFGFFGLMKLVRPDLFDMEGNAISQLAQLPNAMIRNNKATVTDIQGNKIFQDVRVHNREYEYDSKETSFYRTLSEFIVDGRAYAATLDGREQTARMLVLVTLQKLAASSIAAIRKTLQKRRNLLSETIQNSKVATTSTFPDDKTSTLDEIAQEEETLAGRTAIMLVENEIQRLDELIHLSKSIETETKMDCLLSMLNNEFSSKEPILLFTEYKTTQALVVNALHQRFGYGSATFINGDDRLDNVEQQPGIFRTIHQPRELAAEIFNKGEVRFLVSTEAGGEGIDLQERCATLVHVDMPWNPMRLHQRVGRLSRYGQLRPVSVYILRNPDTVEARIWTLLNDKLERIQVVLSSVMEENEDISQLVIGMTGNDVFNKLFSEAQNVPDEVLRNWFDHNSATIGGRDVIEKVRELLGNVSRFDFQSVGKDLPKVDLADLKKFFIQAVGRHGRRVFKRDDGIEIKSPDKWRTQNYLVREKYKGLVFDRTLRGRNVASRVLGVGHTLFDTAIEETRHLPVSLAKVSGISGPLLIVAVEDEVSNASAIVSQLIFGVIEKESKIIVLRDWELLQVLNNINIRNLSESGPANISENSIIDHLKQEFDSNLSRYASTLRKPISWPEMLFLSDSSMK